MLSVLVLVLVAGTVAYVGIPKESNPDINIPIVYVSMTLEGIAPEDAERLLVRPMEQELRTIEGVKEMRSTAQQGHASVLLEFDAGFDADQALQDVREQVDLVKPDLPVDADEPTVNEVNVGLFPVLVVTLSGDLPERTLLNAARNLQDALEGLPGVLSADLAGDREEVLEIIVEPSRLEAYNISAQELLDAIGRNNRLVAAGALDTGAGRFSVKVPGLFETPEDVLSLPIKARGDAVVTIRDVTTVRRTFKDATSYARLNGEPAIALEVKKRIGENIIETIEEVRRTATEMQAGWPEQLKVHFIQDESRHIRTMLLDLQNNVLSAILLVMVVVVAALGLRSAGLVGTAIPASFLFGILTLSALGLTVNIVVLFALILAVGMLVDGAIVVTEYADRKMTEGEPRRSAYGLAAKRMAWPIAASTATTLAAFMPLLFWPGVVGEFMKYLPLTLVVTLIGSLLMALIFVPTLGTLVGRPGAADPRTMKALAAGERGDIASLPGITGVYIRLLRVVVRHPLKVLALTVATLIGVQAYYWQHGNGVEFFPEVDPDLALVHVHARGNLASEEKNALMRQVEARVLGVPGIETVYGRTGQAGQGNEVAADVIGTIFIEFLDWEERPPADEILTDIRARTADLAGIYVETREPDAGPPQGKDIQIRVRSRFPDRIEPMAVRLRQHLEQMQGLVDVEDSRPLPGIEWQLSVDRAQAGRFGADITTVGNAVQLVTNGIKVAEYRPDDADDEVDIRVRYPVGARNLEELDQLRVNTPAGLVPIGNFVERSAQPTAGTLDRIDGQRAMTVQANTAPGVLADDKVQEIRAWLATQEIDPALSLSFAGTEEDQQEAADFLGKAFGVAIFIMAIILVTQFNSFYHAFLILTAVIMSTVGVMTGLIVTGQTFGIVMTGIGIIALAGIVVNNNIVLIDTFARLRETMPPMEAVLRTGAQRFRPVMLTTITTIFGLLPMVFQLNIDFVAREITQGAPSTQWWVQLSTAVVFGLGFSTLLTLLVTPSLLALGAKVSGRRAERRAAREARGAQAASGQPELPLEGPDRQHAAE